jgi:hypothetical protein
LVVIFVMYIIYCLFLATFGLGRSRSSETLNYVLYKVFDIGLGLLMLSLCYLITILNVFIFLYSIHIFLLVTKVQAVSSAGRILKLYQLKFTRFTLMLNVHCLNSIFFILLMAFTFLTFNDIFSTLFYYIIFVVVFYMLIFTNFIIFTFFFNFEDLLVVPKFIYRKIKRKF